MKCFAGLGFGRYIPIFSNLHSPKTSLLFLFNLGDKYFVPLIVGERVRPALIVGCIFETLFVLYQAPNTVQDLCPEICQTLIINPCRAVEK